MYPRVYIIVINWNGLKDTIECLNSLRNITYKNYKVILVDNGSKNNEGKILLEKFGDYINLIQNDKNYGFAKGNNIGIRKAIRNNADYVLCLNNDTVVESNFLTEMVESVSHRDKIGMVGGKMINYFERDKIDNLGVTLTKSGLGFGIKKQKYNYFCPSGGAALYSVKMLKDIKINGDYFDSDFFMYAEDLDLAFRGYLKGYVAVKNESAIIYHKASRSAKADSDFSCYHNQRNHVWFIIKNFPTSFLIQYAPYILLGQLVSFSVYLMRFRLGVYCKAKYDSLENFSITMSKRKKIQSKILVSNRDLKKLSTK